MKVLSLKQSNIDKKCDLSSSFLFNMSSKAYDSVIGRDNEVEQILEILGKRKKSNAILVGAPGVGKTAIVEYLSGMLTDKNIYTLDISQIANHTHLLKDILENLVKQNDILFIDEIHTIIGRDTLDIANILKPYLSGGDISCIGATTFDEFKHIEKDLAIERRFSKVVINEPTIDDSITIIKGIKDKYESHHGVIIESDAIESAVKLASRYINDRKLPDSAIDLIDIAFSKKSQSIMKYNGAVNMMEKYKQECHWEKFSEVKYSILPNLSHVDAIVRVDDIESVVVNKTGIPVGDIGIDEKRQLIDLEDRLKERIIGQGHALKALSESIKSSRVGLNDSVSSFLFLGSTGVGKTETAKALSEILFNNGLIRLDMSEYKESHSVSKLIGAPAGYIGYEEGGQLTEAVYRKPYSVILLDEIEKAHLEVWDLFLQVLDDGRLTDNKGRVVNFSNTIIIMTSNLNKECLIKCFKPECGAMICNSISLNFSNSLI